MTHQPQLMPGGPTPEQAAREAERAEYLARLREKLKVPEFRAIEGFPIGEDEDILALAGLRQRHPDDTPAQRHRRLAELLLGPELATRARIPLPEEAEE